MNIRIAALPAALLLTATLALPAAAQEGRNQNTRGRAIGEYTFQLAVVAPGGATLRTIELSCIDREEIKFHCGTKTPIPTTTFNPAEGTNAAGQAIPRVSYAYQNLGLQLKMRVLQQSNGLVFVRTVYDLSFVDPREGQEADGEPPLILSHEMEKIKGLKAGTPAVLAEFFRPEEGRVLAQSLGIDPPAMGNQGPWRLLLTLLAEKKG